MELIRERLMIVFLCCMFYPKIVIGQDILVKGIVTEKTTGDPVIGATVQVKGTMDATLTDMDGKFNINTSKGQELEIRFMGYVPYILKVKTSGPYLIKLVEDNQLLDEVVVVGYGAQKKVNLTGSVAAINIGEEISSRTITSVSSALAGMIPGLSTQQSSGMAGNNNSTLLIRGMGTVNNAAPLIVVDGMPDVDINRIDMNDIESISVLKDASSAAIYGSRAANGVILVTTKTGKGRDKFSIDYTGSFAIANPINSYNTDTNYARNMTMHQYANNNGRTVSSFMDGTIDDWMANALVDPFLYPSIDQMDWVTRQAQIQSHNVSATGANEKTNFYLSIGYLDEVGYMINNDNTRYNFRANFDYKIRDNIRIGTRIDGQWTNQTYPYNNGLMGAGSTEMPLSFAIPGLLPYDPVSKQYGGAMVEGESPLVTNLYFNYSVHHNEIERKELNGTVFGEWDIIDGLTLRGDFGLRYYDQFMKTYSKPTGIKLYNFQKGEPSGNYLVDESAEVKDGVNSGYKTLSQLSLRYHKIFVEKHDFSALLGYNAEYWFNRAVGAGRWNRIHENITEINGASEALQFTRGSSDEEALRSFIGRFNYSYCDRYLAEFNFRVDGSSKFLPGHQYGFFPSGSLGWRFSEEDFFKNIKRFVSSGKLRVSYGVLGNNSGVGKYEQKETLAKAYYPIGGNNVVNGFRVNKMINKDFTWEETKVANIGIDLGFLNNKLLVELDLYDRLTSGMIRPSQLSSLLSGYSAPRVNMGNLRNRGIEVNLKWMSSYRKFHYGASFNASYNRDRLEKWNEWLAAGNVYLDMPYQFVYTQVATGIAQTWDDIYNAPYHGNFNLSPGDILYADLNGDGQITGADKKAYARKNTNRPTGNYGLNLFGEWNGIDINMLFQGATGRMGFWKNQMNSTGVRADRYAFQEWHWSDTWNIDNREASLPRMVTGNGAMSDNQSTYWLQSMNFLRMKNLQLGYTLPKRLITKIGIEKIRFYFSAENLFTLTKWDGVDPEKANPSGGIGEDPFPIMKTFSFGVNVGI